MPLYDYQCRQCGKVTEVRHGFDEPYSGECADCKLPLVRKFSAAPIVFKGSGFYVTDSRKGSSAGSGSTGSGASTTTDAPSSSGSSTAGSSTAGSSTSTPSAPAAAGTSSGGGKSEAA